MNKKTIAVDFDGVIHAYSKGWHDGTIYDGPVPGAALSLSRLQRAGYRVLIYTTRGNTQADKVVDWLNRHGIPFDELYRGEKPIYTAIIDDRAVRFDPAPAEAENDVRADNSVELV